MLKKEIKFKDFDGNDAVEVHYFNLAQHEIIDFESEFGGGLAAFVQAMVDTKDNKRLLELFKDFIRRTWGRRSDDGKRFVKDPDEFKKFMETPAYDALYMELALDHDAAANFIIGVVPEQLRGNLTAAELSQKTKEALPPPPPPVA